MSKLELKTWTIGTSLKSYYDKIVDWLEIDNFYSKIKKESPKQSPDIKSLNFNWFLCLIWYYFITKFIKIECIYLNFYPRSFTLTLLYMQKLLYNHGY